ncbi:MAG TPA: methyltransferase domain-containing protein [Solirubrobacteraceae bacterium]|nr:methyltransferase domain-containing protein [Solirubrobacteraceae bacterium]
MGVSDPDAVRAEILERWGRAAAGWSKRARSVREFGLPASTWMLDHAGLQPGLRVLELAAGPGETGFLAAELIRPGGSLICSDATDEMLVVARARADELGIENVEFKRIELEWIDLETASVDAVLCKWGLMFAVDPEAALRESRRVLRPGGRIALAVWDEAPANPWATITTRALVELGHTAEPDPDAPGMFALGAPGRLQTVLENAGFVEVFIDAVEPPRAFESVDEYIAETDDLSNMFGEALDPLSDEQRAAVLARVAELAQPYVGADGVLRLPARSLVAAAEA